MKAKGRRAAMELQQGLLSIAPHLSPDDIRITPSGCTGEDLLMSPRAREAFPYAIECKNVERINIWEALKQAKSHSDTYTPLLAFTRNREEMWIAIPLKAFLSLSDKGTVINEQNN